MSKYGEPFEPVFFVKDIMKTKNRVNITLGSDQELEDWRDICKRAAECINAFEGYDPKALPSLIEHYEWMLLLSNYFGD